MTLNNGGPAQEQPARPLPAVLDLLKALDDAEVGYCHWKSNEAIAKTLSAENDLDLLVARRDAASFNEVLHGMGYRVARPSAHRHIPGMVDHYSLDADEARMVHVQAHYQLVLGDDMTKNFRLPIEDAYLASCHRDGPIPVPDPTLEYLVFVLRMVVKHCPLDAQASRRGRLGLSERRELVYLEALVDEAKLEALRSRHVPEVSGVLLASCRRAVTPSADRLTRARVGYALLRALEPRGRLTPGVDLRLRVWRRLRRRHEGSGPASRRSLDNGGVFVALVGGDGSGKSSAVDALNTTFARHFPTHQVHLGKPSRSPLTRLVQKMLRVSHRLRRTSPVKAPPWADWDEIGFPGLAFVVTNTLTARDRARTYMEAKRAAGDGALVISDRMPLEAVTLMDSPRCGALPGLRRRPLAAWLARREAAYYEHMGEPDVLIVLRVNPAIAVARRSEQDVEFVRRRAEEVWSHDWTATAEAAWPATAVHVVDASQPQDVVQAELHRIIWDAL